jgi:aminotransferase
VINVFQPALGEEELQAVRAVFESNWVGKGKITEKFEHAFSSHLAIQHGLVRSVSCCTEGLFAAMESIGVSTGDEVVMPSISFVGAGNAVAATGARPVFCDVDPRTLNATPESVAAALTKKTKAVILLHYGGVPADVDAILPILKERGVRLVEDSACSVASRYKGRACGTLGDIGVWSFDAMKILVTGDGGMVYCSSEDEARRIEERTYLGLGCKSGLVGFQSMRNRWWEFNISCFGRRAITNDIASAIGLVQIKRLPAFVQRRKAVHEAYDTAFSGLSWLQTPPKVREDCESSYYLYWIQTEPSVRDRLAGFLKGAGIYTTFRYHPLHRVRAYRYEVTVPGAEWAAERTLCLPIHQSLSDADVDRIVDEVKSFGKNA